MKNQSHDLFAEHHRRRKITQFTKVLDSLSGLVDWAALTKVVIERTGREASQPKGGRGGLPEPSAGQDYRFAAAVRQSLGRSHRTRPA